MADAYQILSDCPNCRVEGAVVELRDPGISDVESLESKCRLCGREETLGELVFPGQRFQVFEDAHRALTEWASREGESSVDAFCQSSFGGMDAKDVVSLLLEQQVVETNFDVMAHLFFGMSQGSQGRGASERATSKSVPRVRVEEERPGMPISAGSRCKSQEKPDQASLERVELSAPGLVARSLSAVMLVDGQIRRVELRYIVEILSQMGLPGLVDEDVRSWRADDLPTPRDPLALLRLMIEMAGVDGALDDAEWRVIREFGRSWGVSPQLIATQRKQVLPREKSQLAVLWRGLKSLVVSEVR